MDQTINLATDNRGIAEFYDALAADYDLMTGFAKRFVRERPFFHFLVEKYRIQSALDAGCGTGFHALLLAQLGVDVTAIDISPRMISFTRKNARQLGLGLRAFVSNFENLPDVVGERFDAVMSLGNSLAHAESQEGLQRTLGMFASVLHPGGILFIQNLNYDRILANRQKVQSQKEVGDKTFIRYYDYDDQAVVFNLLTLERTKNGIEQTHKTVKLFPLMKADLTAALDSAGFTGIQTFGGISMDEFDPGASTDLVILAKLGKKTE